MRSFVKIIALWTVVILTRLPLASSAQDIEAASRKPEYLYLDSSPGQPPLAEDYNVVNLQPLSTSTVNFNNQDRIPYRLTISGKHVVLEPGDNVLWADYLLAGGQPREDLSEVEIHAETLTVKTRIHLPSTRLSIFAREIQFQDIDTNRPACFETTPVPFRTAAEPKSRGKHAARGGNVDLHVARIVLPDPDIRQAPRFILTGGTGQTGGVGEDGAPGISRTTVSSNDLPPNIPSDRKTNITLLKTSRTYIRERRRFWDEEVTTGARFPLRANERNWKPTDGRNATPGGQAGSGGSGGNLILIAPTNFVVQADLSYGKGGQVTTNFGGKAGQPNPAYYYSYRIVRRNPVDGPTRTTSETLSLNEEFRTKDGKQAVSPAPSHANITNGVSAFILDDHSSWLTPLVLRQTLAYARDCHLVGQLEMATGVLREYRPLLQQLKTNAAWENSFGAEKRADFAALERSMDESWLKLSAGLDFYGNPPGWVPRISVEASKFNYQQEIERAIDALYVEQWLTKCATDIRGRRDGTERARNLAIDEIKQLSTEFEKLSNDLPPLQTRAAETAALEDDVRGMITRLEKKFLGEAKDKAEPSFWRKALGTVSKIVSCLPVPPMVSKAIQQTSDLLSSDHITPMQALSVAATFSEKSFKADWALLRTNISEFSTASFLKNTKQDLLKQPNFSKLHTACDGARGQYVKLDEAMQQTRVPNDRVAVELARIKAQSSEFKELTVRLEELLQMKESLAADIQSSLARLAAINAKLSELVGLIDSANKLLNGELQRIDDRTFGYLKDLGRRSRERLFYAHYLVKKSYEYRALEVYPVNINQFQPVFDKLANLASQNNTSTPSRSDYAALGSVFRDSIREMTARTVEILNKRPKTLPPQSREIPLDSRSLQVLSADGKVKINLADYCANLGEEENARISNVSVESYSVASSSNDLRGTLDFFVEPLGYSTITWESRDYRFSHWPVNERPLISWISRFNADGTRTVVPANYSSDESWLAAMISDSGIQGGIRLFENVGLNAPVILRHTAPPSTLSISNLKIKVDYEFITKPEYARLAIRFADDLAVPFKLDVPDVSGRCDGQGNTDRCFKKGMSVKVTLPLEFEAMRLKEVVGDGIKLNTQDEGKETRIAINLSTSKRFFITYYSPTNVVQSPDSQ